MPRSILLALLGMPTAIVGCGRTNMVTLAALPECDGDIYLIHHADGPLGLGDASVEGGCAIEIANASGSVGRYVLRWSEDGLHVVANVKDSDLEATRTVRDDDLHDDDSVEMMFDTGHDGGDAMRPDDYKLFVNIRNTQRDSRGAGWPDPVWDVDLATEAIVDGTIGDASDIDQGYQIELAVTWSAWGVDVPAAGTKWGMNVVLNDAADGSAVLQTPWSGTEVDNAPDTWGTAMFVDLP